MRDEEEPLKPESPKRGGGESGWRAKRANMVERLVDEGILSSRSIIEAFLSVPRELFLPAAMRAHAYEDEPLPIGYGQTISAPHMVGIMCEALELQGGQKVLEIGCGSGYHAAITASAVGGGGTVFSVERHNRLARAAAANLAKAGIANVRVVEGDGSCGLAKEAPFDRIYVTCAAPRVPPPLVEQLKPGGILLVPVGNIFCELVRIKKDENGGGCSSERLGGCAFVPLRGKYGF
ncbi:MAG: protein-L-isoaspartate O-methyltransferase [Thermoplasmata archaeon HGW-Thermoplasmata-1]|nr:MAG: protein-L-isoaspartate O-methyltransferase [Thermoplasmata archaeon HGW-Thermoplasmata-1]